MPANPEWREHQISQTSAAVVGAEEGLLATRAA
jgi:hypothetical protein